MLQGCLPLSGSLQKRSLYWDFQAWLSYSLLRRSANAKSCCGVCWVFLISPCSKIISPPLIWKITRAILPSEIRLRTSQRSLYPLMERQTGIPMGQPYSTVLISPPIIRLSSLSKSFSHSLTGSVPEAVLKNLAGRIFSESFIHMLYHIWYNMSSSRLRCKKRQGTCGVMLNTERLFREREGKAS